MEMIEAENRDRVADGRNYCTARNLNVLGEAFSALLVGLFGTCSLSGDAFSWDQQSLLPQSLSAGT